MTNKAIPIYRPYIDKIEEDLVTDCMKSTWISSKGAYINKFEEQIKAYVNADYCTTTSSGTSALHLAMLALNIGKDDEVITTNFTYVASTNSILLVGAKPVFCNIKSEDLNIDVDSIESKITPKTKAIVINSPNNPTGAVYLPSEIEELASIAAENDLWIFDDMIYSDLVYSDHSYASPATFPGGKERTLTIGGWSKIWAMTGWRLGWITGPSEVMEGVKTCQASSASHVPTFLMGAAAVALDCEEERESFFESFAERRDVFHALLQDIPGIVAPKPEGAFYILADITGTGMDDIEFATRALDEANVQLVPGSLMPGGEGLVRMSYGTNIDQIREGCKRLKNWLQGL